MYLLQAGENFSQRTRARLTKANVPHAAGKPCMMKPLGDSAARNAKY